MTLTKLALAGALLLVAGASMAAPVTVPLSAGGSTNPQTSVIGGDAITTLEIDTAFGGDEEDDAGLLEVEGRGNRPVVNRSLASFQGEAPAEGRDHRRAPANPQLVRSFNGVNFFDQRFSNHGNQFSVEPPDQALCVGAGFVVESANDVMRIFDTTGALVVGPVDLNTFYRYPAAIDRTKSPLQFGPSITDPVCLFDKELQRFFHVVLTLDRANPLTQGLNGKNHLDIAVSDTSNPTGTWTVFKVPVQNDGTDGTPNHGCVVGPRGGPFVPGPCLGDYPHIGADANAIFLTTNEFDLAGPFFRGAQIYAISKRALASRSANVSAVLFDTADPNDSAVVGHTVWAAQSPGRDDFEEEGHGTEFLLSSDAVFNRPSISTELIVWTVSNTRSINTTRPDLVLNAKAVTVNQYGPPPKADQKPVANIDTDLPLRDCLADPICFTRVTTLRRINAELKLDSNDSRMQQVTFAKGKLWGALDTAVTIGGAPKAGIAFFVLSPKDGRIFTQGTIAVANNNVTYPAIGVTENGKGVIAFTLVGADHFPSAAFAVLDARRGVGPIHIAAEGAGAEDGFAGYLPFGTRQRWGDYGAAASDGDSVWIASEFVAQSCTFAQYNDPSPLLFGTCGGTRGPLGNWATRISQVRPGDHDDD